MSRTEAGRSHPRSEPKFVKPMECTPVAELPDDPSKWSYEVKLDGYRCCAVVRGGRSFLYSRYGNSWPERFPQIHAALAALRDPMALDGEICAIDRHGHPSFQELQNWQSTKLPIVFYAFDVLHFAGRDLRRLSLEERREILAGIADRFTGPLLLSKPLDANLSQISRELQRLGLEGLVAKRRGSLYEAGVRSKSWVKRRFNDTAEFVIGGYIPGEGPFARLLVGEWDGDRLVYVMKLKNGFTRYTKEVVFEAIRGLRIKKCPFVKIPADEGVEDAIWVRPVRRVEVEFVERTGSGKLRHAAFRRMVDE